jgi:iron complex outermembrane receptor protein
VIVNETTLYGDQLRVLKSADILYPAGTTPQYIGETEGAYRDGAKSSSAFLDLDARYRVNQDLTVKTLFSTTRGVGQTGLDQGLTYTRYGTGVSYALGSLRDAPFVQYYGTGPNVPGRNADGSGYVLTGRAASGVKTTDKEHSLQFDGEYRLEKGLFQSLEAGVRYADHRPESARRFPQLRSSNLAVNAPAGPGTWVAYPSDFGAGLDGPAGWDNTSWTMTRTR